MKPIIDHCIQDAITQLSPQIFLDFDEQIIHTNDYLNVDECQIFVWPQKWNDASTGFGGLSCQMINSSSTLVVIGPMDDACIYHGGEFAYKINKISNEFWSCIKQQNLPGKNELDKQTLLKDEENVKI